MEKNQTIPLYDVHQVSWLNLNDIPIEFSKHGSRVVFEVPSTPKTYQLLAEYNENPKVNLLDFVGCLRKVRSQMLSIRDNENGNFKREGEANGNFK